MSYCRFGTDSEVYVFARASDDKIECCACIIGGGNVAASRKGMLRHLAKHANAGHRVPAYALERLRREIAEGVR